MTDNKTRVERVNKKAGQLSRKRRKRKILTYELTSAALALSLIYCIGKFPHTYKSGTISDSCGSILLTDGISGYVLTAVAAFTAAVVLTLVCQKFKHK